MVVSSVHCGIVMNEFLQALLSVSGAVAYTACSLLLSKSGSSILEPHL